MYSSHKFDLLIGYSPSSSTSRFVALKIQLTCGDCSISIMDFVYRLLTQYWKDFPDKYM